MMRIMKVLVEGLYGGMGEYMKVVYSIVMDDGKDHPERQWPSNPSTC
jgi:hypothetical protein